MIRRGVAAVAVVLGTAAVTGLAVAVGWDGTPGYVSEVGVPGTGTAGLYRLSVLGIALTTALVAATLWEACRQAAALLAAAAPAIALSAAVTCTAGCPLPPYTATTPQDLLHAGASIAGVGCSALAMLAAALWSAGRLRVVARAGVAVGWPPLVATAICIAAVGRSGVTGLLERFGLLVCLVWMLATSVVLWAAPRELTEIYSAKPG